MNGKTIDYLEVGEVVPDEEGGILESTDGNLTVVCNGSTLGKIIDLNFVKGTLDIQGGVIGTDLSSTEGNSGYLTCNGNSGSVTISGGTFREITNKNASTNIPVMSLLADGYAFYGKDASGEYTVLQDSGKTTLENVKVLEHNIHTFMDGKCIACDAMTCEESEKGEKGGCIAHVTILHYTWHLKTLDKIAYHLSAAGEWSSNYETVYVEFLSDVTTDTPFCIKQCFTYATLDLNGHTISGKLSDSPVSEVDYDYGVQRVIIQNGTIENTAENGTALRLSSGATTLENVNVKGNLALASAFVSNPNYIPTFLGGGSFTKIRGVENDSNGTWSKRLGDMLGAGCYMVDSAGSRLDAGMYLGTSDNSNTKVLENVQCKACDHKDADGKYTLFVDAETKYGALAKRCKTCGNLCPHDEITTDGSNTCTACGLLIFIRTTNLANNKNIGPWYYTGLDDAMNEILHVHKGRRPIITLLEDTESACSVEWRKIADDGLTIDLAGHMLKLIGDNNKACSEKMKFRNTSDTPGKVLGTVNVDYTGTVKLIIPDTDNNLTIETVKFGNGTAAELAGGSFGKITVPEGKPLAFLLVSGYYFADSTSGKAAALYDADGTALTELTNVTVAKCSHDDSEIVYVPNENGAWVWKCPCGQKTFVAGVTTGDTMTLYTDLQEAFRAADGGTVKLMASVVDVAVNIDKLFTLDLNGYTIHSLTVNSKITLKDSSEGTGKIAENLIVNVDGLTVGDLLKEGYAFRSCLDNSWPLVTGKTVGNVSVQQVPIKNVAAVNPTVRLRHRLRRRPVWI